MKEVIVSDFGKYSPFEMPLGILKKFGIWSESASTTHRLKKVFKHAVCLELFIAFQFAYFFDYESNADLAYALCQFPSNSGIFLKAVNFSLKKPEIEELLTMTKELYDEFPLKHSLMRRLSVASKVTKFCFASLKTAVSFCIIGSAFELPVRTWTPFDVKNNQIGYWITAIFQLMGLSENNYLKKSKKNFTLLQSAALWLPHDFNGFTARLLFMLQRWFSRRFKRQNQRNQVPVNGKFKQAEL